MYGCCMFSRGLDLVTLVMPAGFLPLTSLLPRAVTQIRVNPVLIFSGCDWAWLWRAEGRLQADPVSYSNFFVSSWKLLVCPVSQLDSQKKPVLFHALYQGFADTLNSELSCVAEGASTHGCSSAFIWGASATTVVRAEWDVHLLLHHCL